MKKMTKVLLTATVLPIVFASSSAFAKGGDKEFRGDKDFRGEQCEGMPGERGMMKGLDLTNEQKVKMMDLRDSQREARKAQMKALHEQEHQIIMAKNFDEKAAEKLAKQMVDMQAQKRVQKMKDRFDMMSILTPEQKAKLEQQHQEQAGKGGCGMDHKGHGPKHGKGQNRD